MWLHYVDFRWCWLSLHSIPRYFCCANLMLVVQSWDLVHPLNPLSQDCDNQDDEEIFCFVFSWMRTYDFSGHYHGIVCGGIWEISCGWCFSFFTNNVDNSKVNYIDFLSSGIAVLLPWYVQNGKTFGQLKNKLWPNPIVSITYASAIHLSVFHYLHKLAVKTGIYTHKRHPYLNLTALAQW